MPILIKACCWLQLATRDRRITALEQETQAAQEVHGTPRRSVRAAAAPC